MNGETAVLAYLSDPADESFGEPWGSVTVNLGSFLQDGATVLLDTNNMSRGLLEKVVGLGTLTGESARSGFCDYPAFTFDKEVMGNMRDTDGFLAAEHVSLSEVRDACRTALSTVYGADSTQVVAEEGYDLGAETRDMASAKGALPGGVCRATAVPATGER